MGAVPMRTPPQDFDAEQAILAGVLINNDAMNQVLEVMSAEDFYREAHVQIFSAMVDLYDKNKPIDTITLAHRLKEKGKLEQIGGKDYLTTLMDSVSTSAGISYHCELVKNSALRRQIISGLSIVTESCHQNLRQTQEILDFAEQTVFEITEGRSRKEFVSLQNIVKENLDLLATPSKTDEFITGVPTGFSEFDRYTAGLQKSDLIIIAGRPGMGKTAFALNIAHHAASVRKIPVAVFSLEMSKMQLGIRLLGFSAKVDIKKVRTGSFIDHHEWGRLTEAAGALSEIPLYVEDSSSLSVLEMKSKCRRLKRKADLGLVIVDYLQLIQGRRSAESRNVEISEISRSLKALAKEMNVPVIALSQMNRRVEDRANKRDMRMAKKPQLSDLRESGAIEQDADMIVFLYKDDSPGDVDESEIVMNVDIAKQRNGPMGSFKLSFQRSFTRFEDYAL